MSMRALLFLPVVCLAGCVTGAEDEATPTDGPVVASCNTVVGNNVWAVAEFPGLTVEQLTAVHAVGHPANGEPHGAPPGFEHVQLLVFVRDGEVGAGPVTMPVYDYVIFAP
jgi:hypothetical protein